MGDLVPYHVILAAKAGDSEALEIVIKHYDPLITKYATRSARDEYGNTYEVVDNDMKMRIVADLVYQIIYTFDPRKLPLGETLEK